MICLFETLDSLNCLDLDSEDEYTGMFYRYVCVEYGGAARDEVNETVPTSDGSPTYSALQLIRHDVDCEDPSPPLLRPIMEGSRIRFDPVPAPGNVSMPPLYFLSLHSFVLSFRWHW